MSPHPISETAPRGPSRLLLVQPDPLLVERARDAWARVAEEYGIHIEVVDESGLDAAAALHGGARFDLALIEVPGPESAGLDLLESLHALPDAPPRIALGAHVEARLITRCMRLGAAACLRRPDEPMAYEAFVRTLARLWVDRLGLARPAVASQPHSTGTKRRQRVIGF